jgi:threonine dehydrogenase-like Zn-dependent dehydrogenase
MDPVLATFTEPLACALRAQRRAWLAPGDAVLVVGAGASGLLNIAAAHAGGVEAVWVREPQPDRLARAERWGATAHGNEPVDVAIVCTPQSEAIAAAAGALAPGGALCLYAPPPSGSPLPIDGNAVFMRELDVTASWSAGPADMRAALGLLRRGAVQPLELVTHRFGLEQTGAALAAQRSGEALKAVVLP